LKRLAQQNLNTPEHFDEVWQMEGTHRWDAVRMRGFTKHVLAYDKVADFGAGVYGWAEYLMTQTKMSSDVYAWAIDFSRAALHQVMRRAPRVNYQIGNVLETPWPDEFFDVVGAGELIEHMEDPRLLLREMARVMKDRGGRLIIGTVDPECEDSHGIEYPEHLWQFTPDELRDLVGEVCSISEYYRVGNYDFVLGMGKR
jgi:ubiquinone/menaquinone biosynthesis C-methylase UbiE